MCCLICTFGNTKFITKARREKSQNTQSKSNGNKKTTRTTDTTQKLDKKRENISTRFECEIKASNLKLKRDLLLLFLVLLSQFICANCKRFTRLEKFFKSKQRHAPAG